MDEWEDGWVGGWMKSERTKNEKDRIEKKARSTT